MSGFCDSAHFRETLRSYWISRKLNTPHAHFHHNNRHARPFSLYAGSVLRVHISAEYGADGWWKIIIYDNKMSPDAVQLTCSLSRTTSQLFACYYSLCQLLEHLLLSSAGNSAWRYSGTIQTKVVRTFFDEHYSLWASLPYCFGSECNDTPIAYHMFASEAVAWATMQGE